MELLLLEYIHIDFYFAVNKLVTNKLQNVFFIVCL